ncbi:DnaJ-domain-containing protein [Aaosphaeria arxii CBS 175.79]|uniref:DnaJ-domain-containing protein n=1 Tax=Aaosphaeria arxii CBS 175.79 TaxID=1450172 RepID=A0A6A5XVE9_9PLEO|nr:DnaJ-domain-containing protein [Aaosphaeria arxii CBS 175.79]KAF2017192.1 DnaJ-domain-containing protein [Aaosphaeria arxii CBS 175.79]
MSSSCTQQVFSECPQFEYVGLSYTGSADDFFVDPIQGHKYFASRNYKPLEIANGYRVQEIRPQGRGTYTGQVDDGFAAASGYKVREARPQAFNHSEPRYQSPHGDSYPAADQRVPQHEYRSQFQEANSGRARATAQYSSSTKGNDIPYNGSHHRNGNNAYPSEGSKQSFTSSDYSAKSSFNYSSYRTRTATPKKPPIPDTDLPVGLKSEVDLYAVLGVPKSSSAQELKKVHRQLSLKHHPDRVPAECKEKATEQMAEINRAYDVLKDNEARRVYDTTGKVVESS